MAGFISNSLSGFDTYKDPVTVQLSNQLVHLLSDQLYQSPLKAVEELVVNSYDADANECYIYVPTPDNMEADRILVFDDGVGMSHEGLVNLWHIGRSEKSNKETEKLRSRKQIGKFGIGKLATRTIANRLTHISKAKDRILAVTINFGEFVDSPTGAAQEIKVPVRTIDSHSEFFSATDLDEVISRTGIKNEKFAEEHWTLAILEDLTDKAREIKHGRLSWVLKTAMPLKAEFKLYLNGEQVISSKENYTEVVSFDLTELPESRLEELRRETGAEWRVEDNGLKSPSFEFNVSGKVIVTDQKLVGKSDDIGRSHGFFVRTMDRLINYDDPLFGLTALPFGVFNRFRADIYVDDLNRVLKASRETVEESTVKDQFQKLLRIVWRETEQRYNLYQREQENKGSKREGKKNLVAPQLIERPIADALTTQMYRPGGAEADNSWFYLGKVQEDEAATLIQNFYTGERKLYKHEYRSLGKNSRLVKFEPSTSTFLLNENHELVQEYKTSEQAKALLEDVAIAESLLEVYLREAEIPDESIGEVLERRDKLLRSLAKDHSFSLGTISGTLRDAASDEHELEISLVVVARALGFVANQISGAGQPDGVARFTDYPEGTKTITLEAKSSSKVPSLSAIDFAGLDEHRKRQSADGCLLVAPSYPSHSDEDSAASFRARELQISCWTVSQLADFVEAAESRHLTAQQLLDIVLNKFMPTEVEEAVRRLLEEPAWSQRDLYVAALDALRELEGRMSKQPRTIDMVATEITRDITFRDVEVDKIDKALRELSSTSQGGLTVTSDKRVLLHVNYDELERRVNGITKQSTNPRRISSLRDNENS